jgi:hypothetical protein
VTGTYASSILLESAIDLVQDRKITSKGAYVFLRLKLPPFLSKSIIQAPKHHSCSRQFWRRGYIPLNI